MKTNRRGGEIFSMSFLDVICCGFGAVVLLILLAKTDVVAEMTNLERVKSLFGEIIGEKKRKTTLEEDRDHLRAQIAKLEAIIKKLDAPNPRLTPLKKQLAVQQATAKILRIQTDKQTQSSAPPDEKSEVGGIPVDSDHIIFIVDTSGSMQQIWQRVLAELENILDIHPKVIGFQIMNDNGYYLMPSYARRWIPDTPGRRRAVLSLMRYWTSASSSSPVEGLEAALKSYARRTEKLAIYIFGDDYTGSSYGPVLDTIARFNLDPATGRPLARIHAIGFLQSSYGMPSRFATLMREVARRNRGAFIALGH